MPKKLNGREGKNNKKILVKFHVEVIGKIILCFASLNMPNRLILLYIRSSTM